MLVKNIEVDQHIIDIEKNFDERRRYEMKLNPNKFALGITSDKFLEFLAMQYERKLYYWRWSTQAGKNEEEEEEYVASSTSDGGTRSIYLKVDWFV